MRGLTCPHLQDEASLTLGAVSTAWTGPAHAVSPDFGGSTGDIYGDTRANSLDAGCATAGWPEYRFPGNPDRMPAEPFASGACVPAGIQR